MKQDKPKLGRPPIEGARKYLVRLTDAQAQRARELGNGKVAAGVRAALTAPSKPAVGRRNPSTKAR